MLSHNVRPVTNTWNSPLLEIVKDQPNKGVLPAYVQYLSCSVPYYIPIVAGGEETEVC